MANGLTQQIAKGIDVTTPLLRGVALARQGQQDRLAIQQQAIENEALKQAAIQKQKDARLKGIKAQQDVLIKLGDVEGAMRLMPDIFKEIGGDIPFDVEKLIQSHKEGRIRFDDLLSRATKATEDRNASQEQKQLIGFTLLQKIAQAGEPDSDVSIEEGAEALATVEEEGITPQTPTQPTTQQITREDIATLRSDLSRASASPFALTPQGKAMIEARESEIDSLEKGLTKPSTMGEYGKWLSDRGLQHTDKNEDAFVEFKQKIKARRYAPQLEKWTKEGEPPIYIDMNQPEDVVLAQEGGYTQAIERDVLKEDSARERVLKSFNTDPNVRKYEKMESFASLIVTVSESDNPIGHASLETLMARASGEVGNLSEADKRPFGGSRALDEKMEQFFSEIYSGKKSTENLGFIRDLAQTFRDVGRKNRIKKAKHMAKQYSKANKKYKWTPDEVFNFLMPDIPYDDSQEGNIQYSPVIQDLMGRAKQGDKQAQTYLKGKGIAW